MLKLKMQRESLKNAAQVAIRLGEDIPANFGFWEQEVDKLIQEVTKTKLQSLKKHVSIHAVDDDMVAIYKCLKCIYDYMKDEKAKGLFLLCSVFGKDKEISFEVLTRLCIGVGLIEEDYYTYNGARDQVVVTKNKLLDSYFLLGVGEKHVKMHGLVRDAAQWIKDREIQKSLVEELYFIDSFNGFCGEITLPQLRRYFICKGRAVMDDSLSKYVVFPTNDDAYWFSKETLNYCLQTAEVLRLNGIKAEWRNLMPEIVPTDLGKDDLVELCLSCISQLQFLVDDVGSFTPNVLSKLVVLKLDRMENLEEIFNGSLSYDCLKNLEEVSIKDCKFLRSLFDCKLNLPVLKIIELQSCPMLVSIFSTHLVYGSLVLLETLKIAHCERLEKVIVDSSFEIDEDNICHVTRFPKLKVIDIEGCHIYESTFPFLFVQDFPVLETLKIRRCDGLKHIFGKYQHVEFPSLTQLELCHLPNFINMFHESSHPISSSAIPLPVDEQPQDNSVALESESYSYCLNIWERAQCLQIQSKILYNIKKIDLSEFSKIKSVFILSIVPKLLLESLTIRNCDELEHIIDFGDYDSGSNNWGNIFPELKELHIEGCAQLKYIFGGKTLDQQNHIKILLHLPRLFVLSLRNLPSLVTTCPERYRTTFPPLAILELLKCPQASIKSMGDFIIHRVSECIDSIIILEFDFKGSKETDQIKNLGSLNDDAFKKVSSTTEQQFPKDDASKGFPNGNEVQATSGYDINIESDEFEIMETKMKQTTEGKQEFAVNVPGLLIPLAANSKVSFEDITTLANAKTTNQVSLNDDAFMKVSSTTKEQIPKDDNKVRVSKSRPSTSITSPIAS